MLTVTFHGVGTPPHELTAAEREAWLELDAFHAALDALARRRDVAITFDDGNASDLEHALPALRDRGLRATFFVLAGPLGAPGWLDVDGVQELLGGGMDIGCHGMDHRDWRTLDDAQLGVELVDARAALEEAAGRPIATASCPFGSYDRRVLGALRAAGYARVYTSDEAFAPRRAWLQPRCTITRRRTAPGGALPPDGARRRGVQQVKMLVKRCR